jgi:hypothetical protein
MTQIGIEWEIGGQKNISKNNDNVQAIKKFFLIVSFLTLWSLSLSGIAGGGDWTFIEKSREGTVSVFIDKESIIQISEDIVKSCQKFSYLKPIVLGNTKKLVSAIIICREWNCDEAKYNNLQLTFCYTDGTKETETYQYALWHYVRPNSPEGDLFEYVCTID